MPGERIGIIAVIENPNPDLVQRGVTFASSLPAELEVLADSLHASGGVVSLVEEDGRQRVSWSGQVPAQNAVVIRYQLGAVAANASPRWIVVTAEIRGDNEEMNRFAVTQILLNPYRAYLPFAATLAGSEDN